MKTAFIFPGQGSQNRNIICDLYNKFNIIKHIFSYGSSVLNYDIYNLIKNKDLTKLTDQEIIQPTVLIIQVAIWNLWKENNKKKPNILIGHSLGEYSALVCSGILKFKDAIEILITRAKLMKKINQNKNMISVLGLKKNEINNICKIAKKKNIFLEQSLFNSNKHMVLSYNKNEIIKVKNLFNNKKTKIIILKNNIASHCKLMFNISKEYKKYLLNKNWYKGNIPVIHNANVNYYKSREKIIKTLTEQLYKPVMWKEIIKYIEYIGVSKIIECNTNNILTNMNKYMNNIKCNCINDYNSFKKT